MEPQNFAPQSDDGEGLKTWHKVAIGCGVPTILGVFLILLAALFVVYVLPAFRQSDLYSSLDDPNPSPQGLGEAAPSASPPTGPAPAWTRKPPEPSVESADGLALQNVGYHRVEGGGLNFLGEVLNEREERTGKVEVTITLYDRQGKPLATETSAGYASPKVIEPGQRGVWEAYFDDGVPERWQRTEIIAVSTSSAYLEQESYPGLEAGGAKLLQPEPYGTSTVRAEVVNAGEGSAVLVDAAAALYDAESRLVDVELLGPDEGYNYDEVLSPGDTMLFEGYLGGGLDVGRKGYEVAVYPYGERPYLLDADRPGR